MLKEMRDTMYSHINKNCRPPTSSTELFNKRILSTRLSMTTQLTKQKKKSPQKKAVTTERIMTIPKTDIDYNHKKDT
jgi:hypothetical protein